MTTPALTPTTLDYLEAPLRLGEAELAGPLAVFPLFGPEPRLAYRAFAQGRAARADQGEVWSEVAAKAVRLAAVSPTGAMHDIYEHQRASLGDLIRAVRLHDGQLGAVAAIGGRCVVLDHVSRPDVFAALHAPLLQGYALDALEASDRPAPSREEAEAFVAQVLHARLS